MTKHGTTGHPSVSVSNPYVVCLYFIFLLVGDTSDCTGTYCGSAGVVIAVQAVVIVAGVVIVVVVLCIIKRRRKKKTTEHRNDFPM